MFEIVLLAYLTWRNSVRAKLKSQNPVAWAIYTVIAYLVCLIIGGMIVVFTFCRNAIDLNMLSSVDPKVRDAASLQLQKALADNPLHLLTIELFAIGGYLFIRYLLDKKPGKKEQEVHWMDKMGEQ